MSELDPKALAAAIAITDAAFCDTINTAETTEAAVRAYLAAMPLGVSEAQVERAKTAFTEAYEAALIGPTRSLALHFGMTAALEAASLPAPATWTEPNSGETYSAAQLAELLNARDKFIVDQGLWSRFVAAPAPVSGDGKALRDALQLCVDMIKANGLQEGLANTLETAEAALAGEGKGEPVASDRMFWFLSILNAMGGSSSANDEGEWLTAFCEEHEGQDPDTYNQAIKLGYTHSTHDDRFDSSTVYITEKGRAFLTAPQEAAKAGEGK